MARQFDGSTQGAFSSTALDLSSAGTGPITLAFWLWWDTFANDDDLALELSANYNSNAGTFIVDPNDAVGVFNFGHSSGSGYRSVHFARPSAAAWHHYMLVIDTTDSANCVAYVDGSSVTVTNTFNTGGSAWTSSQTLNVMCRNDGTSLLGAGRMAGLGIWAGALTAGNATSLAAGAAPSTIGTPLYSWNICGASSPEPAANGTPVLLLFGTPLQVADPPSFTGCGAAPVTTSVAWLPQQQVSGQGSDVMIPSGMH